MQNTMIFKESVQMVMTCCRQEASHYLGQWWPRFISLHGVVRPHWLYTQQFTTHDDVIKWKSLLRYWPFVREIHQSLVNFPHKGQWRATLMFSLTCAWTNGWVNNRVGSDWRRHRAYYDVTVMHLPYPRVNTIFYFHSILVTSLLDSPRHDDLTCRGTVLHIFSTP